MSHSSETIVICQINKSISFKFGFWLHYAACGIFIPWLEIRPVPPALEGEVLTTGLPGKFRIGFTLEEPEKP